MNRKEIVEKAVQKALDNGWQPPFEEPLVGFTYETKDFNDQYNLEPFVCFDLDSDIDWVVGVPGLFYRHDFAKALWDKPIPGTVNVYRSFEVNGEEIDDWKYHLMQMVIADDPIKYLGEHI